MNKHQPRTEQIWPVHSPMNFIIGLSLKLLTFCLNERQNIYDLIVTTGHVRFDIIYLSFNKL